MRASDRFPTAEELAVWRKDLNEDIADYGRDNGVMPAWKAERLLDYIAALEAVAEASMRLREAGPGRPTPRWWRELFDAQDVLDAGRRETVGGT